MLIRINESEEIEVFIKIKIRYAAYVERWREHSHVDER
jgi:hypothetical protein